MLKRISDTANEVNRILQKNSDQMIAQYHTQIRGLID